MRSKKAHTPTLLQLEATECGAATLGMILGYHGCFVPLADLRRDCGVSRDGSKASNMVRAASDYGMDGTGYSVEIDEVSGFQTPYIVFWQFNHFLVVEGFTKEHVLLNDPAMGHRKVDHKEFDDGFTGILITFEKNENFTKRGSPPRALPSILSRLKPQRAPILQALFCGLLLVAPALLVPACTAIFVDEVLGGMRVNWFRPLLLTLAIAMVVQFVVKMVQLQVYRRLRTALFAAFSGQFQWHLLRLPLGFYAQRYPGEIANRARLNEDVAETISTSLVSTGIALCSMLLYGFVLFCYDATLATIGVAVSAINFIVLKRVSAKRVEENMRLAEVFGRTASVSISALTNIESIKASAQESDTFGRWSGFFTNSMLARQRLETTSMTVGLLPSLLQTLTVMLILVIGGFRVMQGALTIGELTAFQSLMLLFLAPVGRLVGMGTQLQDLQGDLLRLDDVLANEPETTDDLSEVEVFPEECVRLEGSLEVRDLTFGYSPLEPPIIDKFHFKAQPGSKIAFVGGSGSGKSTVAKLLGGAGQGMGRRDPLRWPSAPGLPPGNHAIFAGDGRSRRSCLRGDGQGEPLHLGQHRHR